MKTWIAGKDLMKHHYRIEDITDKDYIHAQNVFEELKLKNLDDYHDLYVRSDTLLFAYVFEDLRNKCIEIYELDPPHFWSAPRLAWQACLTKTEVELELLTNNDMLLMVEKGIRGGIFQVIHRYAKSNNKYMKNYDKNTTSSYLMYLDANNLYGWAMSQKRPVNDFEWVKELSECNSIEFNERFIKNVDENRYKRYFLEVDIEYSKNLLNTHMDLPFLPERNKIKKCNKLVCNIYDKENYVLHIKASKEALNHELILNKVHWVIQFN